MNPSTGLDSGFETTATRSGSLVWHLDCTLLIGMARIEGLSTWQRWILAVRIHDWVASSRTPWSRKRRLQLGLTLSLPVWTLTCWWLHLAHSSLFWPFVVISLAVGGVAISLSTPQNWLSLGFVLYAATCLFNLGLMPLMWLGVSDSYGFAKYVNTWLDTSLASHLPNTRPHFSCCSHLDSASWGKRYGLPDARQFRTAQSSHILNLTEIRSSLLHFSLPLDRSKFCHHS